MQRTRIDHIERAADDVVAVTLARTDEPLTPWEPGAHIDVVLPTWLTRQYSLCGSPTDADHYRIAVRHDPLSRGGSEYINLFLRPGRPLPVSPPRNTFPLTAAPRYLFVAGGIGITAILPMMRAVTDRSAAEATLLYVGPDEAVMPFTAEIRDRYGDRSRIVATQRDGRPDLGEVADHLPDETAVYCCGPAGMLEHCTSVFPADRLHLERFRPAPKAVAPSTPFEVVCARSGTTVTVAAEETMLEALLHAGRPVASGCREGVCGCCDVVVLEGTPDHRDDVGARPGHMYPCVSRAASDRLVIDL